MMKTELRVTQHLVKEGEWVIELWYDGQFVGQIAATEGASVQILSKYKMTHHYDPTPVWGSRSVTVEILAKEGE